MRMHSPTLDLFPAESAEPNLRSYDIIVVNSSGGKDSQAMLDFVAMKAKSLGILDRVVVVHADLGRVEWAGTKELAAEQAAHYGLRFEVVKRSQDLLDHIAQRGMFPSSTARYCTSDHKRAQISTVITRLTNEIVLRREMRRLFNRGKVRLLNCMGFRAEESAARAKRVPFCEEERLTNGKRHCDTWLPIHDWGVERVWQRIKLSQVRHHFAYDLGMPRLSCAFCIFAPESALLLAGKHNPTLLSEYVAVEKQIGHTFRHKFSLADVQAKLAAGHEPGAIQNWSM